MNVVILEVTGNKAVAMTDDGQFIHLKARRGMQPGCEFRYEEPARPQAAKFLSAVAAVFVMLVMSSGLWQAFAVATRVDIRINPAVRISVNASGQVLRTEALNDDGRALLAGMPSSAFESLEATAARIIGRAVDDGYLKPDGRVSITVEDSDAARAESKIAALQTAADDVLREKKVKATVNTHVENAKAPNQTGTPAPTQTDQLKPHDKDNTTSAPENTDKPRKHGEDATQAPESTHSPRETGESRDDEPDRTQPAPKPTKDAREGQKEDVNSDEQGEGGDEQEVSKTPAPDGEQDKEGDRDKKGRED